MKKIIVLIFLLSIFCGLNFSVLATEKIEGSTSFTWDKLTQTERDTDIQTIRKKIFTGNVVYSYDKDVFEKKYADFKIKVPACETYRIQEYHLPVYHTLCSMIEEGFYGEE